MKKYYILLVLLTVLSQNTYSQGKQIYALFPSRVTVHKGDAVNFKLVKVDPSDSSIVTPVSNGNEIITDYAVNGNSDVHLISLSTGLMYSTNYDYPQPNPVIINCTINDKGGEGKVILYSYVNIINWDFSIRVDDAISGNFASKDEEYDDSKTKTGKKIIGGFSRYVTSVNQTVITLADNSGMIPLNIVLNLNSNTASVYPFSKPVVTAAVNRPFGDKYIPYASENGDVVITEYGPVGGYVSGYFYGYFRAPDLSTGSTYIAFVHCKFKIKREPDI